jgi:hypothetical protein
MSFSQVESPSTSTSTREAGMDHQFDSQDDINFDHQLDSSLASQDQDSINLDHQFDDQLILGTSRWTLTSTMKVIRIAAAATPNPTLTVCM